MNYKLLCDDSEWVSGYFLVPIKNIDLDSLNIKCIMCILSITSEALRIRSSLGYNQL